MTVNTNHVTALSVDHRLSLWTQWIALRKGYLHNGDGILSPTFTAHLPSSGARAAHQDGAARAVHQDGAARAVRQDGRAELLAWAAGVRAGFSAFDLSVEVGPILGVGLVAGRWVLSGIARSTGAVVTSAGVDIIRVDGGRIVELWISHDHVDPAVTRSA